MNNNRLLTILLITCLYAHKSYSQSQVLINGIVRDITDNLVPFANIYTKQNDTSSIIAFGSSNDKGYFSFETTNHNSFVVFASAMGYETKSIKIENNNQNPLEINFILTPKEFILKETIVRGSNKIIQKSDTITFNADRFRDSTERNLEELLAKIPGLDVDKNTGVITVQGQPIKKILIDGDDLTGRNYQLMSKNMAADVVDKIQVIDRFTENKLLKGLKRSDDKVINITLKENRKKLLFGNVLGGIGNDERTNNSLNLFGFYKKLKTVSFGNFNTIGQISTADRMLGTDFKEDTESENLRSLLKSRNNTIIDIGRTPSVSLNSQSVRFNKAALGSTHFVVWPTESISLKGALTFSHDRVKSFINNDFVFLLKDSIFKLSEKNNIIRQPTVWEGHLDAQFDLNSKSLLRYKGDFRKSFSTNTSTTQANNNLLDNKLNNNGLSFSNTLDFTHRINDYHALTFNVTAIQDDNSQILYLSQNQPRITPSVSKPFDALSQRIETPLQYYAATAQWLFARNTLKLSHYLGAVLRNEDLNTALMSSYLNNATILPDSFRNKLNLSQKNYYIGINVKEEWLGFQFFSDISGGFHSNNISARVNQSSFYALPTIGFKRGIKEKHNFFGTYAYNYALPQSVDLSNGFILTDYRSMNIGSQFFIPQYSHTAIFNYKYGNFADEFLWHFNILHTSNSKGYRSNFNINADFNISDKVENNFTNKNTIISGSIEKYMSKFYMRLKIRPSIVLGNYPNTLNGSDIRNTNAINSQFDISLRSAYLKWFNFHIGSTLNQSNITTQLGDAKSEVKNHSIGSFVDFYLKFNSKINAKIENEVFYFKQQNANSQKYYFVNANLSYDIIKTKLSASLSAKNILNTNEFINSYVSDFSTQINRIQLLPRYVLLELNYRF
jgi:CarboxypepD_reg-like domain